MRGISPWCITIRAKGESQPAPQIVRNIQAGILWTIWDSLRSYLAQPKVWIMGHAMGGFQVLNYGIHHSDQLYGIIAIAAMAGRDSLYNAEFEKQFMKRKGQPFFEKGFNVFSGKDTTSYNMDEFMKIVMPFYFHDPKKLDSFNQFLGPDFTLSDSAFKYTGATGFGTEYLFPELNKITVPTLVVVGDDDFICDKISQADRIAKNIPNATELVIKDAGHFSWVEQPEEFFGKCASWLKAQGLSSH